LSERSPAELDRRQVRRRFGRAAGSYAAAARLEDEVAARMLERLEYVKLSPRRVLDAGSGPPRRALRKRYPGAVVVALDASLPMLLAGQPRFRLFGRQPFLPVCADFTRLPFSGETVELVWSNMALHWAGDAFAALKEFRRVLAPGGLLMFSTLGPDTLKELRTAAGAERVHAFADMHDVGDMLLAAGFSAPVMDMELLTFTYAAPQSLIDDLRATGQTSARADRRRGLAGKSLRKRLGAALAPRATFEIVYGHAWKLAEANEAAKTVRIFKRMP
jgi:malonyl-CoA O-methyltransferase